MTKIIRFLGVFCLVTLVLSSCIVSKKKYLEATGRADKEHADNVALNNRLAQEMALTKRLYGNINELNQRVGILRDSVATLERKAKDLNNRLAMLGSENENATKELNSTKEKIAEQRRRLEQLQELIDQQQRATENLRKKIADALVGFNSNELTITMKNGKVYISMQESLLFPSGSAEVNPKGKEALSKVASVLITSKDINIDIEGHTDSLPIHTVKYADNWAPEYGPCHFYCTCAY